MIKLATISLVKFQSFGNDFLIGNRSDLPDDLSALALRACDRRRGVGADGLIAVEHNDDATLRMHGYNANGGRFEVSGNGLGCLGAHHGRDVVVLTDAGPRELVVTDDRVRVDMGMPKARPAGEPYAAWGTAMAVDVGNPHVVITGDPDNDRWPQLLHHVEVNVEVVDPATGYTRVWERGVGETQSCGSGACAVAVALNQDEIDVRMPGGTLTVTRRDGKTWLATAPRFIASVEFA